MKTVADFDGFIAKVTREALPGFPAMHDDAIQEARIEVWRGVLDREPDPHPSVVACAARRRARAFAFGHRSPFGSHTRSNQKAGTMRGQRDAESSLDALVESHAATGAPLPGAFAIPDHSDAVALRESVRFAVALLEPDDREAVFAIFWEGRTFAEAAKLLGVSTAGLRSRWRKRIVPALRSALSDLAPAA